MRKAIAVAAAALAAGLGALAFGPSVSAEVPMKSPAVLWKTATHVVVGTVRTIYSRTVVDSHWRNRRFVAEVAVEAVEKGAGIEQGGLAYVRYWDKEWLGRPNEMPTGASGHSGDPKEGDRVRIYLARNAHDGYDQSRDGGFNVIGPNGFQPPTAATGAAPEK
jgi:hypothetical protein